MLNSHKAKFGSLLLALFASAAAHASDNPALDADLHRLESTWAHIKYQVANKDEQLNQMEALAKDAETVINCNPGRAEPLVWNGVIVSTEAGLAGPMRALVLASGARKTFEAAGKIDPKVLDGAVPTSLGSLYYLVPGFPLGFGNNKKARGYLEQGIEISPNGLDSNFFYGDFLFRQHDYANAKRVLTHALEAPANADRRVWDAGRRAEFRFLMIALRSPNHSI